jgi:hypothetical protein
MNDQILCQQRRRRAVAASGLLILLLIAWSGPLASRATADDPKLGASLGKCVSETATLFRRPEGEKTWHIVAQNDPLPGGELLVGLPGAMLDSANGAVRMLLLANLSGLSPYPVKECGVVLRSSPGVDLELTLDRGRAELINRKETGAAHVRIHVRKETWDLTLSEPGTRLAVELYGRWPRGVPFTKEPGPKDEPTANLVFLVLHGEVALRHDAQEFLLTAPPGPAMVEWDSVTGQDESPQRLEKPPPWAAADADESPEAQRKKALIERFRKAVVATSLDDAVEQLLNSEDVHDRTAAVYVLTALDNLKRLGQALREAKHSDIWENGVLALRHWIGRKPGQDQLLYQKLIEVAKYKPVHAETVVQLLHSFGDVELAQPETYQTLIDYLDHDMLFIRGLAYWHLYRLAPDGREFGYNPLESKEARQAAIQKWRKLVPAGKIPPRPKAGNGK